MKVFLAGGTGFLGSALAEALIEEAEIIFIPTRKKVGDKGKLKYIKADLREKGDWIKALAESDVVINFSGYPIYKPWLPKIKKLIWESRVSVTKNIAEVLMDHPGKVFISASAIGIYGDHREAEITEESPFLNRNHFMVRLCENWEKEAEKAAAGNRVVILRIGVVVGESGGIKKLFSPFAKLKAAFCPCPDIWISWIKLDDFCKICLALIKNKNAKGAYNMVLYQDRHKDFLKKALGIKHVIPVSCSLFRLLGEQAKFFSFSQKVIPKRLLEEGFLEVEDASA